ncbi:putative leucine-rich repeat-containing protein DDB_G0290503 [Metopolophium dirhodum]|uniref:putative leucine-rich repeat-containing protein DDB_G0290503 n=1 Tax=Metopolophium dirhodum TaxID=44670 RepID=UPI00299037C2|nr:putative leucine-rich repeat-containing protein DDB_G0290503 [Metopolophium dirhodum]
MASRQSVSSILKPPKVRAPLKEIESVDQDADENTATLAKRKVSFSGMNKIKMYNTGATSLTVHQAPMFDEQISMLSDSSNAEKPKLSGKFEKSDAQISIESTNCTNLEDNGRIIIEYESPNDNMEMTEALSGKILSDTIYTIDNNGSEHISYSSDYSENSMEFTEALKVGQILTGDNSCTSLSSTEMSETLDDESDDEPVSQLGLKPSTPLSDVLIKNPSNVSSSSSCMDFTCANAKSNLFYNTQSSNMELTGQNMTLKSSKSIWSNDDYKCMSMELTQLPDRQTFEDNCELVYEYSQHSISMGSADISCELQEKQNCEVEIVQTEKLEKNNVNHQTIGSVLNNSDNREAFIEELSSSMVSMDIDPTLEGNEFDISYVNVEDPLLVMNEQNHSIIPTTVGIEDSSILEKSVLDNYSNVIDITNQNSESRISIFPTGSSFVVNMSPENNLNKYVEVEELLQQTLHGHTSVLDENQYLEKNKSIVVEKHPPKKYSRKTMIHTCPLIVQDKAYENEDIPGLVEENHQNKYSRKSVAPTSVFNEDVLDTSEILEENQQQKCSLQSISMSAFNQTQSFETENLSDTSGIVKENHQNKYSRKSVAPTSVFNKDVLDTSETLEENQQQDCSLQSIAMSAFNQTQSLETENLSDTSGIVKENHQNKYSRKSVAPTSVFNEVVLDTSETLEENQQQECSLQSIAMSAFNQTQSLETENLSDTSGIVKENHQNKYSRKSVAPTFVFNDYVLDASETLEENQQQKCSLQSIAMSTLNQIQSLETEDVPNTSVYNPTKLAGKCDTSECNSTHSAEKEETFLNSSNQSAEKGETSIYNSTQSAEKGETSLYNSTQSTEKEETSLYNSSKSAEIEDTSVNVEEYELKRYSRKSIGPASLVFTHSESLDNSILNNSSDIEESYEPTSEKGTSPVIPVSVNNLSILQSDVSSHYEEKLIPKIKHQSVLLDIISDDNFNSPFRKKPKKSIVATQLPRLPVEDPCIKNELETTDDIISGNFENVSKMDISMDISIEHEFKSDNELLVVSKEGEEPNKHNVHDDMLETNEDNFAMTPNELEISKTNLNELVKDNDIFEEGEKKNEEKNKNDSIKVTDNNIVTNHILNSDYHSSSCSVDKATKLDETFQNNEKSCLVNRKRSYSNRDCVPLSCSSFTSKPNIHNSMEEDLKTDYIIQQSPIKNDIVNMSLDNEQLAIGNELEVELIKKESIKESLCNECLEFLTRWNEQFTEKKLALEKCTNREWIFNLLDSNIILTVTYSYISNNYSLLKVEDILFTAKTITKNEIVKFGINWILSKYNPKVYKQICFTSRDVELLLKSLLEDVDFISKVMNNMSYVSDLYCVTFKDNKAQFVIHNMKCLLMVRIEITLSNVHKLSFKDLSVDCLFGYFDTKLLEEIMEDIIKDCNVLQSLIEKLFKLYSQKIN